MVYISRCSLKSGYLDNLLTLNGQYRQILSLDLYYIRGNLAQQCEQGHKQEDQEIERTDDYAAVT